MSAALPEGNYQIKLLDGKMIGLMTWEQMTSMADEKKWYLIPEGGYEQNLKLVRTYVVCSVIRTITIARPYCDPVIFTELEP